MDFREDLKPCCPPSKATTEGFTDAYRFHPKNNPRDKDFDSYEKKKKTNKNQYPFCQWSSCSLWLEAGMREYAKTPHFRSQFVSKLSVPDNVGKSLLREDGHIDWWIFDKYEPLSAVVETKSCEDV